MKRYTLHNGDNREVLKTFDDNSIDSIVTDPPYELGFMGKKWDASGIAYNVDLWKECLRVLKPGGHLLAFGGTRTYHRMTVAIEDAGFEIRESIAWVYSTGFPKSHNLHGEHQGWGTALKPAHETIVVARKPLHGTVADNVQAWGVGALNIDGCRVGTEGATKRSHQESYGELGRGDQGGLQNWRTGHDIVSLHSGRWPANIIFDEGAAQMLDEQSGERKSGGENGTRKRLNSPGWGMNAQIITNGRPPDSGGASRFFYVAKASRIEREAGLNAPDGERANRHPTIKPIALMRYLVRLVTPRGGVVLDPFMGSGTTGCAAMLEAMQFIGIELNQEYLDIAERRIRHWLSTNMMKEE